MQIIYNLLKLSNDLNAAYLADNLRVMAETTRTLTSLATRVDELATRVDKVHALGPYSVKFNFRYRCANHQKRVTAHAQEIKYNIFNATIIVF